MILKEMADMLPGAHRYNLTFGKIDDIHRFVTFASPPPVGNGSHWMFPEGVDHDTYTTLNSLFVTRLAREDLDENSLEYKKALKDYADIVQQIEDADQGSIEEILDA